MKMGVYGTGTIGSCLATLMAGNGVETVVVGHSPAGMDRCRAAVRENLDLLVQSRKLTGAQADASLALLTVTGDPGALAGAALVMEAVAERPEVKAAAYAAAEDALGEEAILASCTSALLPEDLCRSLRRPERFVVAHPFQPAHLQPLVELAACPATAPQALARARAYLEGPLKRQVVLIRKNAPGFLVNRLAQAMFRECIFLAEEGVADIPDIDKAIRYAVGMRYASIGLMEYFDDVGFQLERTIAENVYPTLCNTAAIQRSVLEGLAAGRTGRAAGEGFYRWDAASSADYARRKAAPFLARFDWTPPEGS